MKISVIVPVYRSEKTLDRCVESLLAQTHEDLEIILVDDGSPDPSADMCDAYSAKYNKIRSVHRKNKGVSAARNEGIDLAKGELVAFVDSDDYVEPDHLEKLLKALTEQNAEIAICGFHHHYVSSDVLKVPQSEEDLLSLYEHGFLNMPWNKLFYREKLGRFPEDLSLGEDLLLNLDYLKKTDTIAVCEAATVHYIQDGKTKTLSNQKRADKLEIAKRIRLEARAFFEEKLSEERKEDAIRVTDTRFLCEVLDDLEALPFDSELSKQDKKERIRSCIADKDIQDACLHAMPPAADYRMLQNALLKKNAGAVYRLCVLRSYAVRLKRALGK